MAASSNQIHTKGTKCVLPGFILSYIIQLILFGPIRSCLILSYRITVLFSDWMEKSLNDKSEEPMQVEQQEQIPDVEHELEELQPVKAAVPEEEESSGDLEDESFLAPNQLSKYVMTMHLCMHIYQ